MSVYNAAGTKVDVDIIFFSGRGDGPAFWLFDLPPIRLSTRQQGTRSSQWSIPGF